MKASRGRARGVTLLEVLVVVAIIAIISGTVAVAVWKHVGPSENKVATTSARAIRQAVKTRWLEQSDSSNCPTVEDLVREELLDKDNAAKDPWGQPWRIECSNRDVTVLSNGHDRVAGTSDDIRVPPT